MTRRHRDDGMITAETAVVTPFLILMLLIGAWAVSLGVTRMRLAEAAREGARLAARGESVDEAQSAATDLAPGAKVRIRIADGRATVHVRRRAEAPLLPRLGVSLESTAEAVVE